MFAVGLSTWSKKVGRKWDQLKRSDSSEFLSISTSRTGNWSPNTSALNTSTEKVNGGGGTTQRIRKRISRVESLRNLFLRHDNTSTTNSASSSRPSSIHENDDRPPEKSKFSPFSSTRRNSLSSKRTSKSTLNKNINLTEKQLLEYLLLCPVGDRTRIVHELLETINQQNAAKDNKNFTAPLRNTCKKNFRSVKNFFKRSLSEGKFTMTCKL